MNLLTWLKSLFLPVPRGDIANDAIRHDVIATGDEHLEGRDGNHHGCDGGGDHEHDDGADSWADDGGSE